MFLIMGMIGNFLGKFGPSKIAEKFVEGAKSVTYGALIVGVARTILVVMEDAFIIDIARLRRTAKLVFATTGTSFFRVFGVFRGLKND